VLSGNAYLVTVIMHISPSLFSCMCIYVGGGGPRGLAFFHVDIHTNKEFTSSCSQVSNETLSQKEPG
jgi:hypothetical protein